MFNKPTSAEEINAYNCKKHYDVQAIEIVVNYNLIGHGIPCPLLTAQKS